MIATLNVHKTKYLFNESHPSKFKEKISNKIFSITYLKIKRISYKLTPFRVFLPLFFYFCLFIYLFIAVEEANLLILVQFLAESLLTIAVLQEKLTVRLL